jgi:hypothetical protein
MFLILWMIAGAIIGFWGVTGMLLACRVVIPIYASFAFAFVGALVAYTVLT